MKMKTCSKCGQSKPVTLEYWHRDKHKRDNMSTHCKACRMSYNHVHDAIRNQRPKRKLLFRISKHNRRALSLGVKGRLTVQNILDQYQKQNGRCFWCNTELGNTYDIDHIKPFHHGGNNTPDNIVCSCSQCNITKSDKKLYVWLGLLASKGINHPEKPENIPLQLPLFD